MGEDIFNATIRALHKKSYGQSVFVGLDRGYSMNRLCHVLKIDHIGDFDKKKCIARAMPNERR